MAGERIPAFFRKRHPYLAPEALQQAWWAETDRRERAASKPLSALPTQQPTPEPVDSRAAPPIGHMQAPGRREATGRGVDTMAAASSWKNRIRKAQKKNLKARIAMYGPAGSGKTKSMLRLATGMRDAQDSEGRILVVDTEHRSSELYANEFDFDILEMNPGSDYPPTIDNMVEVLRHAPADGYTQIVVDSISHVWKELLNEVDRIAQSRFRGNTHSAWSVGTPKQNAFVTAIKQCNADLLAGMRSTTVWETVTNNRGKKEIKRLGTKPEQGKGLEYEFDMLMSVNTDHWVMVEKDRTGRYQDQTFEKPGESLGRELWEWFNSGDADPVDGQWDAEKAKLEAALADLGIALADADAWHRSAHGKGLAYVGRQGRAAAYRELRKLPNLAKDFIQRNAKGEE